MSPDVKINGANPHDGWPTGLPGLEEDPICIVGMACRLPGGIRSPSDLWDFLVDKKSANGKIPPERFDTNGFYSTTADSAGVMDVDGAYLIDEDVRSFDNSFFGINNLEATYMDPQQRKLLEVTFECFESAGLSMDMIAGSNTGVYVANFTHDYFLMSMRDPDSLHRYHGTGSGATLLANRISHAFNLHGPSFTLDTACSSSIHCLHTAVSALKNGECDGAIVAASNLILTPEPFVAAMKTGVLSSSSICQTFGAGADGYGRAEGVNAVYLKTLSAALRDGDDISAVIRGTAINSNGRTLGITLPSAEFQEAVIRKAYSAARLDFSGTDYVECHGTGTMVGDPIEVEALGRCFSEQHRDTPVLIGSVKSNLGHSEATSGLTSLIKVALAFQRGVIPPMREPATINPKIPFKQLGMKIVADPEPWPRRHIQRASLNSFGYGGANAHAVVESFESFTSSQGPILPKHGICPTGAEPELIASSHEVLALPFSAMSSASLGRRGEQVAEVARRCDESTLRKLSYTLASRRPHLNVKACLLAQLPHDSGEVHVEVVLAPAATQQDALPLAFIFTGQGAQYPGMAKELMQRSSVFLAAIREQDATLQALPEEHAPNWTLEETIMDSPDISQIHDAARSQPACTAIQIALVQLMSSWGISPSAVVGHSSGEIAAAYAAGILSLSEAILISYLRGLAVNSVRTEAGMMATGLSADDAHSLMSDLNLHQELQVACVNAPDNVTISGSIQGLDKMSSILQDQGIFYRRLETGGRAYHSHDMKEAGILYRDLLQRYVNSRNSTKSTHVAMYSTVGCKGEQAPVINGRAVGLDYWQANLENMVLFTRALETLNSAGQFHYIEVGPHSTLRGPIHKTLANPSLLYTPTLVRGVDSDLSLKKLAATLYTHGHHLSWDRVNNLRPTDRVPVHSIPPYPWDYSGGLLWFESRFASDMRNRSHPRHELLGSQELCGSDVDWKWRNVLRLDEIPWIQDHKVEEQIIFPAAGYMAVVIEAISQVLALKPSSRQASPSFQFQNVSFSAALVLSDEGKNANTELHTTFSRRKLSNKTASSIFYDFSVSSWKAGKAVVHCGGGIRILNETSPFEGSVLVKDDIGYRDWPMGPWYEKAAHEGLCFGPALQSITTLRADNARVRSESICVTHMTPPDAEHTKTKYAMHPIVIDACLQAAILSAAAGNINTFCPYLPVFIESCRISPAVCTGSESKEAFIHVRSNKTGVSSLRADSSLRDSLGETRIDMQGVRLSRYSGKLNTRQSLEGDLSDRQPIMRVVWKPDIVQVDATIQDALSQYIEECTSLSQARMSKEEAIQDFPTLTTTVGTLLDLLGHKNPRLRVLNLTDNTDELDLDHLWCNILDRETSFSRCREWTSRSLAVDGRLDGSETGVENGFDVVICVGAESDNGWENYTDRILSHAAAKGLIITRTTEMSQERLKAAGFEIIMAHHDITLARRPSRGDMTVAGRRAIILTPSQPSHAVSNLATVLTIRLLKSNAEAVNILSLDELDSVTIDHNTTCLSLLEVEKELLASLSPQAMDSLRKVTNSVSDLIWMTGAGMLSDSPNADLTLAPGLSRSLMMEQPALRFVILDIGRPESFQNDMDLTCENIERLLTAPRDVDDKEYIQHNGLLHVSRLSPDFAVNSMFRKRLRMENTLQTLSLEEASPVRVDIGRPGSADTISFQQIHEPSEELLPPGFIDVEVKAVSLNAKDVYAIHGLTETRKGTIALEFTGRVVGVAADVGHLVPGDAVLVCVPNDFATTQCVPAWQAHKLLPGEDFCEMATLLVTNVAALYALRDRSSLRRGESVLVHSGAGAFGIAAITMAQRIGATVYTTVGSSKRREYLVNNLGVKPDHIFSSRDESFVDGIMQKTNGRGVSVVINSLVGDLMHASWRCVAEFGRFIEVGKRELLDAGKLDMHMFTRSVSFTAFDITEMLYHEDEYYRGLYNSLSKEVVAMFRSGDIKLVPITTFDAADIAQAYRYFSSQDRIGKVVISFENNQTLIPVAPAKYMATFASRKSYLLVGCLGGLGRSITNWMRSRGASKFVFLGRSGSHNPQAADLVQSLERSGSRVMVVRGDVANRIDVRIAVKAAQSLGPVGGVVHAAMGLHEDLFSRMSNEGWQTSVRPKWAGAWNLHNALHKEEEDPDFFLLTSSMTGTVGVATESNYCAANAFLDAFAYWRRAQGKRATSIGLGMISEVGYLHENPKIESLLLRRGIKPLNEDEFLQVVDLAITGAGEGSDSVTSAASLMLTGMETCGVRDLLSRGYEVTHTVMDDQRSAILSAALESSQRDHQSANRDTNWDPSTAQWLKGIHQDAATVLKAETSAGCLKDAIEVVIGRKFSNLLLIPPEKVDYKRFFADFGVDSMIASEFRTWFWNVFKVDVPFLDLLGSESNLSTVAAQVEASLVARLECE